ncbi:MULTISPECIES: pro-sigmaK processing inhibitor BofA family protein [Alicyclobacillus]|uniref:Pro-sigmaK processing inhibitor BofA family protein n=1 Tax=Alicyclobacillus acidoterrestris (strain ATCC 49025 / DSM 3922 / CIP 106132 / NCIMB 13137 / GD3B) TaxID=1356854 RepID=T0CK89_ALIAG|nr:MULTISPECIES: pro-sigmaK processing inhibitor BofA family protein [Alicyclobacillus]EPZ53224.1 hypothetical protein N007_00295 [Alicyclobacillus acidoterrestris ATCC 49025]UNO49208.1 pro-sigmaK processing inhibitor BofA family protein [Alicyclobacillus acidoterrestris]GEO26374.1 sigmaK-factor processing regulatory BofA [Alicyclobacillus acidoterrestris]
MHIPAMWLWVGVIVIVAFLIGQFFRKPGTVAWLIVRNCALGCLFVFAVNWVGTYLHFHLPFNPITALTAGFLGLPGIAALVALKLWVFAG